MLYGSTVLGNIDDCGKMEDLCTCTTPAHLCPPGSLSEDGRGRPSTAISRCYQFSSLESFNQPTQSSSQSLQVQTLWRRWQSRSGRNIWFAENESTKYDLLKIFVNLIQS